MAGFAQHQQESSWDLASRDVIAMVTLADDIVQGLPVQPGGGLRCPLESFDPQGVRDLALPRNYRCAFGLPTVADLCIALAPDMSWQGAGPRDPLAGSRARRSWQRRGALRRCFSQLVAPVGAAWPASFLSNVPQRLGQQQRQADPAMIIRLPRERASSLRTRRAFNLTS